MLLINNEFAIQMMHIGKQSNFWQKEVSLKDVSMNTILLCLDPIYLIKLKIKS